jgi:HSP20 family protein
MAKKKEKELTKVRPKRAISPFDDMGRFFEGMFRKPFSLFGPSWWPRAGFPDILGLTAPSVDVFKRGKEVVVKVEVPGMKKGDIDVSLSEDSVTISGEKKKEEKVEEEDYYRYESSSGSFSRTVRLPEYVNTDKAKAKFTDGVLEITLPMTEEAKKKGKKIKVE